MAELIYPELSYRIVGILFKVYNQMGGGYQEKYYQNAIKRELFVNKMPFLEQVRTDFNYNGKMIGRYYIDFIIDHKIVLEIKTSPSFTKKDVIQVLNYLRQSDIKLGILVSLNRNNIFYKRILKGNGVSPENPENRDSLANMSLITRIHSPLNTPVDSN